MTINEAIKIVDPETSKEALLPYAYDNHQQCKVIDEACKLSVGVLRGLLAFKKCFDDLYGNGLKIANWHINGYLEPFDNFYEAACNELTKILVATKLTDCDKQQWISVEDRLPDAELQEVKDKHFDDLNFDDNPSIEVIVIISGASMATTLYYDGSCFRDEYGAPYSVTHWQPLPEPPQTNDNGF